MILGLEFKSSAFHQFTGDEMSKASSETKDRLLKMSHGTAGNKLRKSIIFWLAGLSKLLTCFRCHQQIENVDEFSIEHKVSWQRSDDPQNTYFDIKNIAFSHLKCNTRQRQNTCKSGHTSYKIIGKQRRCTKCRVVHRKQFRVKHPEQDKRSYRKSHGWI